MNPWGIVITFVGFVMLYIGMKGTQKNVVAAFSKNAPAVPTQLDTPGPTTQSIVTGGGRRLA